MKSKTQFLLTVLFWGSIWGIIEATLGWVLHATHLHHGTSNILFAFGIFCMLSATARTGKGSVAVMLTAVVAAIIKMCDFFLPGGAYILLEGAMITVVSQFFSFHSRIEPRPNMSLWESRLAVPAFAVAVALTIIAG